jgi:hypothetical protein
MRLSSFSSSWLDRFQDDKLYQVRPAEDNKLRKLGETLSQARKKKIGRANYKP